MSSSENFAKYLAGEPLNEELKALKEGRLPEMGPILVTGDQPPAETEPRSKQTRSLTRPERIALKEMRVSPAWPVLQFLLKRATLLHIDSATVLSQDDPLGKGKEVAELWGYVKMFKRAHVEFNLLVEAEIGELDAKEKPDETESTVRRPRAKGSPRQSRGARAGTDEDYG